MRREDGVGGGAQGKNIIVNKISRVWWSGMPPEVDFRVQERIPEEKGGEEAPEDSLWRDAGWRVTVEHS